MLAVKTGKILRRLKDGIFDTADADVLEQIPGHEFVAELESAYSIRFQERRLRNKWEVGIARTLRHETAVRQSKKSLFPIVFLVPVFRNCIFLSGEKDALTGLTLINRMVAKPIWKPCRGLALTSGRGYKLDKTPDGWILKPHEKKTVKLSEEFLEKRGWQFDALWKIRC